MHDYNFDGWYESIVDEDYTLDDSYEENVVNLTPLSLEPIDHVSLPS